MFREFTRAHAGWCKGLRASIVTPALTLLYVRHNQVPQLPPDFQGKEFTKAWVSKLHGRSASYELSEEESRQLTFELESAYNEFMALIQRG